MAQAKVKEPRLKIPEATVSEFRAAAAAVAATRDMIPGLKALGINTRPLELQLSKLEKLKVKIEGMLE